MNSRVFVGIFLLDLKLTRLEPMATPGRQSVDDTDSFLQRDSKDFKVMAYYLNKPAA